MQRQCRILSSFCKGVSNNASYVKIHASSHTPINMQMSSSNMKIFSSNFQMKMQMSSVAGDPIRRQLYDNHIPTTPFQKSLMALSSGIQVLFHPERADLLAVLGEVTGRDALSKVHADMVHDPIGSIILREKPRVRTQTTDFKQLSTLPQDTFGKQYFDFLQSHKFDPDGRATVQYVDDIELAYVATRYRECHDFWHVLFDLPPTVFGEIILKYVELTQTSLPVCALSGLLGPLRLTSSERRQLRTEYIPWAYTVGKQCDNLMNVYYEQEFETPLSVLRERLKVQVAPPARSYND